VFKNEYFPFFALKKMMKQKQLAQVNIAKMKAPLDDPMMKEFVDFLGPINQLAEESPGFIWRLKDEEGGSSSNQESPLEDDSILVNMSVWEDLASLKAFSYQTVHTYFIRNGKQWFEKMKQPHMVLWWVEAGHHPTVAEAAGKLELLAQNGPTPAAFLFSRAFDANGKKWVK